MPWRSRCLCIGYRAVPWCPLSSSKLPDTYAIHLHLHLHLLILLVILSSRHSPVYYYYTPSLPPLVPNRLTNIWTLPLADITAATAAVLLDKPILKPRHQPLNTSLDIYLRDKTINRHYLDNHHQQQLTQPNSTRLNQHHHHHHQHPRQHEEIPPHPLNNPPTLHQPPTLLHLPLNLQPHLLNTHEPAPSQHRPPKHPLASRIASSLAPTNQFQPERKPLRLQQQQPARPGISHAAFLVDDDGEAAQLGGLCPSARWVHFVPGFRSGAC